MYQGIRNDECLICEKSLLLGLTLYSLLMDDPMCFSCRQKLEEKLMYKRFASYPLISFYKYNDEMSSLLIRYKDFHDIVLAPVFLKRWMWLINIMYKDYKIILIPSSERLLKKRGFSHLNLMLQDCKLEVIDCLTKGDEVQRFAKDRHNVRFEFLFQPDNLEKIIIFDDVITSGSSMRAAIDLLAPICSKITLISITTNIKEEKNNARKSKVV